MYIKQKKSMRYYHISPITNVKSILENGLKSNGDGELFIFNYGVMEFKGVKYYADELIADRQLGLEEFALFEIHPKGITSQLIRDNVAEITSSLQWIVKQDVIVPKHVKWLGIWKARSVSFI
jgi:hypothetical protein